MLSTARTRTNPTLCLPISFSTLELSIVNTVRRVLYIIRDEHKREQTQTEETKSASSSSSGLLGSSSERLSPLASSAAILKKSDGAALSPMRLNESGMLNIAMARNSGDLRHTSTKAFQSSIVGTIVDYMDELKMAGDQIANQALDHLHAKEIVLTYGKSRTVEEFLKFAAQKRTFEVVVVESSPGNEGQEMAVSLAEAGIETCLIPDSAIFAIMARVNKVIVGTHAVMANGGLLSVSGSHMLATAAKHFNVPFVVCTGLYKLSPLYAHDQDSFNELKNPSQVLPFADAQRFDVAVKNPAWDYVPPELVSLYITNFGAYSPTYVYRLLAEYYHPEDMDL